MKIPHSTIAILCIAILCSWGGTSKLAEPTSPIASKPKGAVRIMTYNVGAISKFVNEIFTIEDNIEAIANVILESETDVVAFQELDSCNTRNNYYQLKALAEDCGPEWDYFYAPTINYSGGKYGIGIATKGPKAIKTICIPLPAKGNDEPRALAIAEYKDYVVASTHLNGGQIEEVEHLNAEMKKLYGDSKKPVFLGGDMNASPDGELMDEFRTEWTIISKTTESSSVLASTKPCIDYVLQLNNKAKRARVLGSAVIGEAGSGDVKKASDHYAVYVDVRL